MDMRRGGDTRAAHSETEVGESPGRYAIDDRKSDGGTRNGRVVTITLGRNAMRRLAIAVLTIAAMACTAPADAKNGRVKIGVLHDASGPYSQNQGPGDVVAVRLALE